MGGQQTLGFWGVTTTLKSIPKVWYNFICATLNPSLHLSTVTKDKTILLYAIVKNIKFNVGYVTKIGIIESAQGRCTGALIHPSLITILCKMYEVPMLDFEEQSPHKRPIPLPTTKNGSSEDSEDDTEERRAKEEVKVEEVEEEEETDEAPVGPLDPCLQRELERLSVF